MAELTALGERFLGYFLLPLWQPLYLLGGEVLPLKCVLLFQSTSDPVEDLVAGYSLALKATRFLEQPGAGGEVADGARYTSGSDL